MFYNIKTFYVKKIVHFVYNLSQPIEENQKSASCFALDYITRVTVCNTYFVPLSASHDNHDNNSFNWF